MAKRKNATCYNGRQRRAEVSSVETTAVGNPRNAVASLKQEIQELKEVVMASFSELMQAIETNGLAIAAVLDTVNEVAPQIKKALEDAANGMARAEDLQQAIALLNMNTERLSNAKDVVKQLVPSVESPTNPTQPGDTQPVEPSNPVPETPDTIEIVPSEVGLPGTVNIDV